MNKKIIHLFAIPLAVLVLFTSQTSCKSKVKDADVKTSIDKSFAGTGGNMSGVSVDVKDGVVTLSGQVKDESAKSFAENVARDTKGVKSVVNNLTVAPPPSAPVVITADEPLKIGVDNAIKAYPGVNAAINDGVVTLTGQIKRADLQNLMVSLNALRPKKIENKLTIN